ncbi:MAG: hypothetical protein CMD42_06055 [Gammaproteobacteria bacterium]|nr:hypothetical protein [Gammaproteobacteria bacterium]|tara:strand:- start:2976 stop:3617 length:642 start_codon:yes stop_codon:yes gene_type:complete
MPKNNKVNITTKPPLFQRLRNYFLTGLVAAAPVAITIWVAMWFVQSVDSWFAPFIPNALRELPFSLPGLGLIAALLLLTTLGFLTANFFGRAIIGYGESLVDRLPLIRGIYSTLKQIFETVATQSNKNFKSVVLFEYPRKDIWAIGFVTTEAKGEISEKKDDNLLCIFAPTTPNPTSGYLLFVPKEDTVALDMSVEDAAKLIISAGLVIPEKD